MNVKEFDIGIIGAGVAGSLAAFKIAKEYKNARVLLCDLGRPPAKRRRQLEGFLGCLPNSDGKFYQSNIAQVAEITGLRKAKTANTYLKNLLKEVGDFKVTKDKSPNTSITKKINKLGYSINLNDYIQIYPKEIHALSRHMANLMEENENIFFDFDDEVVRIVKQGKNFIITTELSEFRCKKIILAVGRSGWRWVYQLFSDFGIVETNNIAQFGIRIETNASILKDFNRSNCTLNRDDIEIGPFSWFGTVIPEDHFDLAISSFRSNENRWLTDRVSFNLIGNRFFENKGLQETDRLGKLTFLLANDRIMKEKLNSILKGKSIISAMKEYDWLKEVISELSTVIPEIINKSYFHVPTIITSAPKINIGSNLETEIDGMFVAGETAGVGGLLSAGIMGLIAADSVCKK